MITAVRTLIVSAVLFLAALGATAQTGEPVLTSTAEYDIGTQCPVGQALSPDGTVLWVLISGCLRSVGMLQAFNVADGSPVALDVDFTDALTTITPAMMSRFQNPMAFTPDGLLSIRYSDPETYEPRSLLISTETGESLPPVVADDALTELLLRFTDYADLAVYSHDHRLAAVVSSTALTVLDPEAGEIILSLPVEEDTYNAFPTFSPDGLSLYVAALNDVDDMDSSTSTVTVYRLADGSPVGTFASPSFLVWPSPDGRFAAVEIGSNDGTSSEMFVVDTVSGASSASFSLYEPPRQLTTCANDGRNMSDAQFTVSGRLIPAGFTWLPDSSGLLVARSYGAESAGATPCAFNYSRLNRFAVGTGE